MIATHIQILRNYYYYDYLPLKIIKRYYMVKGTKYIIKAARSYLVS